MRWIVSGGAATAGIARASNRGMTGWFFRIDAWITGLVFAGLLTIVWALVGRKAAPDGEPRGVPTKGEEAILALLGVVINVRLQVTPQRIGLTR